MDGKKIGESKIPIEWYVPEGLMSQYATNMVIQHTDQEFMISFFEIKHPIILGPDEEVKNQYEKIGKVRAECITRIILTPDRLKDFIASMQTNYEKFQKRKQEESK